MSARMEVETVNWESAAEVASLDIGGKNSTELELECLVRNFDFKDLAAPVREVYRAIEEEKSANGDDSRCRAALALQDHWESCLVQRELLTNEIKRGKECLEQVEKELAALRLRLEDWPAYERVCGKNPLCDYMQAIQAREKVAAFLPAWLERREQRLKTLRLEMEACARQNGLEHLL